MRKPVALALTIAAASAAALSVGSAVAQNADRDRPGTVHCANLIYANNKTSKCFADHFLTDTRRITHVQTADRFTAVRLESADLFEHPFAVMSGEGRFVLTDDQVENLRAYLNGGGFLVASPSCSSPDWNQSFRDALARAFPDAELKPLAMDHPIFHTAYDITRLETKRRDVTAVLEGLTIEGRIVLIYSPEGLNDTPNAGSSCCCCGGNEILNAKQVNVNLLTYAMTH